jgi:hypothetical protein
MIPLARAVVWIAIVVFSVVGLTGILFGPWEFTHAYPLDFGSLDATSRATLFDQLRFFKALELGVGLMLLLVRREIFVSAAATRVAVAIFWITPLARLVSFALDGLPIAPFRALVVVELVGAIVVTVAALRSARLRAPPGASSAARG